MKYKNQNNTRLHGSSKKRIWQRVLSFLLIFALVTNGTYLDGLLGMFDLSAILTAKAEGEAPSYTTSNDSSVFAIIDNNTVFVFADDEAGYKKFCDYCYYFNTNSEFAEDHKEDTLKIAFPILANSYGFMGLGNESAPFAGSLQFIATNGASNITISRALFTHVSTDTKITDNSGNDITLEITKNSSESSPILADYVHPGTSAASWSIKVASENENAFAGVIGQLESNASVSLVFENASSAAVSNAASGDGKVKDVGELCGIMKTGSILTVTDNTSSRSAVSSTNGNAGSLVGTMEGTASLTLNSGYPDFSVVSVTSGNGYAGGLVGNITSDATIIFTGLSAPLVVGGSVTGTTGAGGLYGHYANSASSFDLKDYNITATVYAENCGGVFGVLENNKGEGSAVTLTIQNMNDTGTVNISSDNASTYADNGYFGGLIGKYSTDNLSNSLILDDITMSATANTSFASFGGAIGCVDGAGYIKADSMDITAIGTSKKDLAGFFGGLVGNTGSSGVFVDLGDFTLSADSTGLKGGGVVGNFTNGVLRLSGTTDMSSAKSQKGGQLVGVNNNVLTYALGTGANGTAYGNGWTFKRSNGSKVDDLGTWGEVVRGIDDSSSSNLIYFDSTAHTAKVACVTADTTDNDYKIGTADTFTRVALNIQLNNKDGNYDCLVFTSGSADREDLLAGTITLTEDVDLSGTGINGFMRDGSDSIGAFIGTLNGGSKTVTFAIGEKYGKTSAEAIIDASTPGEGLGQIYAHPYNGLLAVIGDGTTGTGTVSSLEIAGTINVRNTVDGMNIGGIAAVSQGNTSLSGITANQTINYGEPTSVTGKEATGKNIGGLIGLAANGSDNGTIAITGTNTISTTFSISDNYKSWNALGAFIGKVTSPKFTIDIAQGGSDSLTVSHTMVDNSFAAGNNTDGGGLIGYIISGTYTNRKIHIKNLDFNNCTIVNKASTNAGGFLGYAWLDTDTTIDGLTVTNGTVTNSTPNIGVMCYEATGKWTVNALEIKKMSLSGGAGTSLGMLVNKAYKDSKGLYLDILNVGYKLATSSGSGNNNISLPTSLGVYDELAVYSASDVIKGTYTSGTTSYGAGVISVNMNSARNTGSATITTTGTYQNQLTSTSSSALGSSKYPNANTRYYYNLDKMNKSDIAQDIMLWSVNQYAADNIKGEFDGSDAPFACEESENGTDVALSDYSYYPVYSVSSQTLSNINLEFGYNGIYTIEGNGTFNTDSYNRDPGEQNQHYLMQAGLFINLDEGSTLTLDTVEFSGDFLENGTYQGVLVSGTANGSISIDGLVLDGITPKYNNSGTISNYTSGYLLVNNISRDDTTKANIQINLADISTSDKYTVSSATATVAKSLFGDVYGPAIGINIVDVKLDARSANGGLTALDTAYGTQNSIFTTATFFNSIKTSQAATMIYNYTLANDWSSGRNVTYGKEVKDSVEYAGQENKYYNSTTNYTDPTTSSNTTSGYDFGSWRPYVARVYSAGQTADANGCFYREIKVNVAAVTYSEGCGTYNDPYQIDSGAKLMAIAALINDASKTGELPSVILPKTLYNGVAANTTGARWCDNKSDHAVYTWNGSNYTSDDSDAVWSVENVRLYLSNAYYSISNSTDNTNGDIVLGSSFLGLGGTADTTDNSGKFAFRGVIVGNGINIVNNSSSPFVNVSNGCVIKDLTVNQNVNISVTEQTKNGTSAYFGYNSECSYYGGLIGEIMGGDNIIDNSYVTYTSGKTVNLSSTYGTLVPVGGYVGVIVYGGLIFKNMTATVSGGSDLLVNNSGLTVYYDINTDNNLAADTTAAKAAIYVNPIVGRVINGYAINEGTALSVTENGTYHDDANSGAGTARTGTQHTLKNGKKHYSIADIKKYSSLTDAEKLDVTKVAAAGDDGNIDVPNAQALFVLSLITQSTAGTAPELFGTGSGTHTDETVETSRTDDGNGNITVYKTRTITDIDDSLCDYSNSLSYGTYGSGSLTAVYGMSHTATYSDVGTSESTSSDYSTYVGYDTAAKDALPYIISHYTVGGLKTSSTTTVGEPEVVPASTEGKTEIFDGSLDDLDGKEIYIYNDGYYMHPDIIDSKGLDALTTLPSYKLLVTKQSNGKYTLTYNNGITRYISLPSNRELTFASTFSSTNCEFTINKLSNGKFEIYNDNLTISQKYIGLRNKTHFYGQPVNASNAYNSSVYGTEFDLYVYTPPSSTTTTTITTTITNTNAVTYPARCVTSTAGYYDINLASGVDYQLPDSFRGLGCVGNNNDAYNFKVDTFDGKGCTIDEDIYLNKFTTDNYFNLIHRNTNQVTNTGSAYGVNKEQDHHGIGLFDSVVTSGADSVLKHFTVSGSVNTEIYKDGYNASAQELTVYGDDGARFLSVGGVCGSSNGNMAYVKFDQIILNQLSVCGSCAVGGILGYSNNQNYLNNKYNNIPIIINECSATDLSIKMNSSLNLNANNNIQPRNAIGGYVGKCVEGMVIITGDTTSRSNVTIKSFGYESLTGVTDHRAVAGGLVGFAGNGCTVKNMNVSASTGYTVEIGSDYTGYAGGLVGLMQPAKDGGESCVAVFENCTVEKINVNGHYAGGFYGGKWINSYSPYSITLDNCQMLGDSTTNNTIKGNSLRDAEGYAGGFLGCGNVYTDGNPNIEIKDCKVSHYTITSTAYNNGKKGYAGGFIGYTGAQATGKSITCYIHDSSVENCTIGASGNYAGGAIGRVVRQNGSSKNKILGYNIKLDTVTLSGTNNGAWIGFVANDDNTTSIQFTGVGIYGNGFAQNVGNRSNFSNASFVFADYEGECRGSIPEGETEREYPTDISGFNYSAGTHVDMPKYPYVNINPQSSMGTGEIISGDGAVLYGSDVNGFTGTGAETMAAKIYSERNTSGTARQYYKTYATADDPINDGDTINAYMNKSTTDDGDRISNYYDEKGYTTPQSYDNFACIVIANNITEETTALINRYAQLVTNTTTDYAGTDASNAYFDIVVSPCVLNDGTFEIDDSQNAVAGLTYSGGKFSLNPSGADSLSSGDTFTLVDIQFKDPLYTNKIAYHLYIPVYTIKEIEVTFSAAVMSGFNSVSYNAEVESTNPYNTDAKLKNKLRDTHVENLDTWYTTYIRYTYEHDDLEALLDSGNLNWNHNKYFYMDKHGLASILPENTYMVLVDPNGDHDKKYQATLSSEDFAVNNNRITFDLRKFKDSSDDPKSFDVCAFNELIAKKIEVTENTEGTGKYNLCSGNGTFENTGDTYYVYTKASDGTKTYYQYVGKDGGYDLSLPAGDIYENYYISIYVPEAQNDEHLYGYYIRTSDKFDAPRYSDGNNAITKSAKVNCYYGDNGTTVNRQVYVGNIFDQTTELSVLPNDLEIEKGNKKLYINVKTTIKPRDNDVVTILESVDADIYHSFNIYLDRKDENGVITNGIYGLEEDEAEDEETDTKRIHAWYSVGTDIPKELNADLSEFTAIDYDQYIDLETNYINVTTVNGGQTILQSGGVTICARIELDFDEAYLIQQFPKKVATDTGVSVRVASNISYDASSLAFSSMSAPAEEPSETKHVYYRISTDSAGLNYYAKTEEDCFDTDGVSSENYSRLGVSGKYSMNEYMPIDSTAQYNVSSIESLVESAEYVRLTMTLQKKTDTPEEGPYTETAYGNALCINDYWGAVQRDGTTNEVAPDIKGKPVTVSNTTQVRITCGDYDVVHTIPAKSTQFSVDIPKAASGTAGFEVDENGYVYIDIGFVPKTGDNFTEYANYKVYLKVRMIDSNNADISGSYADDYLIYTNAKVNHDFLKN
jgi:hypothetical protein